MNSVQQLGEWLAGNGAWIKLSIALGNDHLMIPLVVGINSSVAFMYCWIAHYFKRCAAVSSLPHAREVMRTLRWLFILCAVCSPVFTLVQMVWPVWWLWGACSLIFIGVCLRFIWLAQKGLLIVYSDLEALRRIQANARFVETSRAEMNHIREQLCEVKQMVSRDT